MNMVVAAMALNGERMCNEEWSMGERETRELFNGEHAAPLGLERLECRGL